MAKDKSTITLVDLKQALNGDIVPVSAQIFGVMNEVNQVIYTLRMREDGALEVNAGGLASKDGVALESKLHIIPETTGRVVLFRPMASDTI